MRGKPKPPTITLDLEGRRLLRESIAHWQRMATGRAHPGEVPSAKACPLCSRWINVRCGHGTDLCPVYQYSNWTSCNETPYVQAFLTWEKFGPDSPEFLSAAKKELAFLRRLERLAKESE